MTRPEAALQLSHVSHGALMIIRKIQERRNVLVGDDVYREAYPSGRQGLTKSARRDEIKFIEGLLVALTFVIGQDNNIPAAERYIGRVLTAQRMNRMEGQDG